MTDPPPRSPLPHVLFGAYLCAALLALVWPGPALVGAHVEPRILGLPPAFAWSVAWILATSVALGLYHRALENRRTRGERSRP